MEGLTPIDYLEQIADSLNDLKNSTSTQPVDPSNLEALEAALSSNVSGLPGILSVLNDDEFGLPSLRTVLGSTTTSGLSILGFLEDTGFGLAALMAAVTTANDGLEALEAGLNGQLNNTSHGLPAIMGLLTDDSNGLPEIIGLLKGPGYGLEALEAALSSNVSGLPGILSLLNDDEFGLQSLKLTLHTQLRDELQARNVDTSSRINKFTNCRTELHGIDMTRDPDTDPLAKEILHGVNPECGCILFNECSDGRRLEEEEDEVENITIATLEDYFPNRRTVAKKMQDYNTCSKSIYLFCK